MGLCLKITFCLNLFLCYLIPVAGGQPGVEMVFTSTPISVRVQPAARRFLSAAQRPSEPSTSSGVACTQDAHVHQPRNQVVPHPADPGLFHALPPWDLVQRPPVGRSIFLTHLTGACFPDGGFVLCSLPLFPRRTRRPPSAPPRSRDPHGRPLHPSLPIASLSPIDHPLFPFSKSKSFHKKSFPPLRVLLHKLPPLGWMVVPARFLSSRQ